MTAYIVAAVLGLSLTAAAVAPASAGDFATDYFKDHVSARKLNHPTSRPIINLRKEKS